MNTPAAARISAPELAELLNSSTPPRVVDVRTAAEYETAHIAGSYNLPLDVLHDQQAAIVDHLPKDVVLVCKSGQRATKAQELLRRAGVPSSRVLDNGFTAWEGIGSAVDRGTPHWDLERQVRLVAGSIVLSSVLGSLAVPKLKWLAAAVGGGLTFAAVSNTCAMGTALSKLPYNRGTTPDAEEIAEKIVADLRT